MKKFFTLTTTLFLLVFSAKLSAQVPTLNYGAAKTYVVGTTIATLTPTSTGVAAPGYSSTVSALGSGLNEPAGVAVDPSGNLYVACYGGNVVDKILAVSGTTSVFSSGLFHPADVRLDASGNLYIADQGQNNVIKVPTGGGSSSIVGSGFNQPAAVAVDQAGNVYVADPGNGLIKEVRASDGFVINLGYFNNPFGVAVDGQGIVYCTDVSGNLYRLPPAGGNSTAVVTGLNNPNGMWADATGNLFVTDSNNGLVKELPAGASSTITIPYTFGFPYGVTTDALGNLYVADVNASQIDRFAATGGYFISPALPPGLSFNATTGSITGTPTTSSPATTYTIRAWNALGSTTATLSIKVVFPGPPTALSYTTPQTFASGSAITPLSPTKTGVAALGYSTNPIVLGSGFSGPEGVAVDAAGNVYVADAIHNQLKKIPAGGGTPTVLASGFNLITDVAVDKSNNIYVTNYYDSQILEYVGGTGTPVVLGSGFYHPYGIAVDAAGNVYVGDQGNNAVKKIPAGNKPVVTLASGLYIPDDLCVDTYGNVYFADLGNNDIKKIPVGGGLPIVVGTGFTQPLAVAVDAAGNLFVTDRNNNAIKEIYAGTNTTVAISAGFEFPFGICVDGKGDVFVGDYGTNLVKEIKPTGGYFINALPQGLKFDESTGILSGTPAAVTAAKDYTVTAYSFGGSKQATINLAVTAPPAASSLKALTTSTGTLSPAFASGTTSYAVSIPNGTAFITVTPTVTSAGATVKVNGTAVTSGAASGSLAMAIGLNTINVVVTGSGGAPVTTYILNVTRQLKTVDNLSHLALSNGTLTPAFASATVNYTAAVGNSTTSITVTPTVQDVDATVTVNGTAVTSGTASAAIALNPGANKIPVVVTAQDKVSIKTYTVTVNRTVGNDTLSNLSVSTGTLTPVFKPATTSYTVSVPNTVTSITLTPTVAASTSTVTVNGTAVASGTASGAIALSVGANAIPIAVTASDGVSKLTYTITVTRAASGNANLSSIGPQYAPLSPVFTPGTTSYTLSVANSVATMWVKPVTADATATIKVNGTTVASGSQSAPVTLAEGAVTDINVVVTAPNGVTTKTYTIAVTRAPSNVATLSTIGPQYGPLTPVFAPGTTSYSISVVYAKSTFTVTPVTTDANAAIKVNGAAVASGSTSAPIALAEGAVTNINVVVTAQDGTTTKTYVIAVTRGPSNVATLSAMGPQYGPLSPVFSTGTTSYTLSVANSKSTMTVTPVATDAHATIKVNGTAVASGSTSNPVALTAGATTKINVAVTAQDGTTTETYTIAVTRAAGGADSFDTGISVSQPVETVAITDDGIKVHQGISPNGDGIDDVMQIDNITQYPDNRLTIMSRNGQLIFEAKGYDNNSKVFDGRSNKNGQMQLPGTYFYQLDYTVSGVVKHKTGFIVLKY